MPYKQAAEHTRRLHSQGTRPGPVNLRRAGELVPAGRVHAFDADTQEVVCGINAAGLHVFNQEWTSALAWTGVWPASRRPAMEGRSMCKPLPGPTRP